MRKEVKEAIDRGIVLRSQVLSDLKYRQRVRLLELLFQDFFIDQHQLLQKWAALTGQTAQIDTGYIAQFVASIVTGFPGQGFRGKGDDLVDGSEVKSAANISGVDTPRWNHNMGRKSDDEKKKKLGEKTNSEKYLEAPFLFYLLVDRASPKEKDAPPETRIRAWCVDVQQDQAWRTLVTKYNREKKDSTYNLQLHPPVGYNDDLVTNNITNLDFTDILLFDYRIAFQSDGSEKHYWNVELSESAFPIKGRTKIVENVDRSKQRKTDTTAEDLVADIAVLPDRFPGILSKIVEDQLDEVSEQEEVKSRKI